MPRIVHFEIPADNPERAVKFYESVFGWEIKKWDGPVEYWMVMTGKDAPGIDGGLTRRNPPVSGTTNVVEIDNVDEYLKKIGDSGGEIVMPKTALPTVGWMAYCKDTEGNIFGLMQMDPNAK
jgi:predicted enzyme related to lactoylglutathione lyase